MKNKSSWIALAGLVAVVATISLVALPRGPEWTSDSPEALAEFDAYLEAEDKLYRSEARLHLERSVELDPDFVIAKLWLARLLTQTKPMDLERAGALYDEVMAADLRGLRPRERFFVEWTRAYDSERFSEAQGLLDDYLARYPDDPYVVNHKATLLKGMGDLEGAERLYRRLLEISPNFVLAYNELGYITLLQGRFAEAEEYFTSYRFIAPDQANPHDSLGELYIIQGRLDEAVVSLETALEIKPDFRDSFEHLVLARSLMGDYDGARRAVERLGAQENAEDSLITRLDCEILFSELESSRSWREILDESSALCLEKGSATPLILRIAHHAACQVSDWKRAEGFETRVRDYLERARQKGGSRAIDEAWPRLLHMEGVRLSLQGDLEGAVSRFREADAKLEFRNSGIGVFKLRNRTLLVETLLARGDDAEAHRLLSKLRTVNPLMVAEFEETGLRSVGLERS
jgi:tetratricopeptide (TPR) repeat protein